MIDSWLALQGKPMELRLSNMVAAKGELFFTWDCIENLGQLYQAISDAVRTSLGPRGMDKMVWFRLLSLLQVD